MNQYTSMYENTNRMDNQSISIACILSDTQSYSPSEQNAYDSDPFVTLRLHAIFGAGIVVVEDRITGNTVDSKPQEFIDTIIKDHKELQHFSNPPTHKETFLRKQHNRKPSFLCLRLISKQKKFQ